MTPLNRAKADVKKLASNFQEAARRYGETDQTLGSQLGQQQFDPNSQGQPGAAPGAGSAGGGAMGGMEQMGQMMEIPMEMAGQALQAPMQMVGMIGQLPQTLMQGMQSLGGMAGVGGHGGQHDKDANGIDLPADQQQDIDQQDKDKQDGPAEPQHQAAGPQRERLQPTPDLPGEGAAGGQSNGAAPVTPPAPTRPTTTPGTEIL